MTENASPDLSSPKDSSVIREPSTTPARVADRGHAGRCCSATSSSRVPLRRSHVSASTCPTPCSPAGSSARGVGACVISRVTCTPAARQCPRSQAALVDHARGCSSDLPMTIASAIGQPALGRRQQHVRDTAAAAPRPPPPHQTPRTAASAHSPRVRVPHAVKDRAAAIAATRHHGLVRHDEHGPSRRAPV